MAYSGGSGSVASEPAALALLRIFLEMQITWPHPHPTESETLGRGHKIYVLPALQVILVHAQV